MIRSWIERAACTWIKMKILFESVSLVWRVGFLGEDATLVLRQSDVSIKSPYNQTWLESRSSSDIQHFGFAA